MSAEKDMPDSSKKTDILAAAAATTQTTAAKDATTTSPSGPSKPGLRPPYSILKPRQRRLFLGIVATAGFFGPLAAGIYLPALPTLQAAFHTSATAINATVSVFMVVLAVGVSLFSLLFHPPLHGKLPNLGGISFLICSFARIDFF